MLPGETIHSGASNKCPECGTKLKFQVMHSGAGYYIGTGCCCGPITRETCYFPTQDAAAQALRPDGTINPIYLRS